MSLNPFAVAATPRPVLYYPSGLQTWRAGRGSADSVGATVVPVICLGDSITWGVGSDNTLTTLNAAAVTNCWAARLRNMLGQSPYTSQTPVGEGFIFANDSRVTAAGSPVQNLWACTVFGQGYRLVGGTQTLTITIPTGVTSIGVIQGNQTAAFNSGGSGLADVSAQYNINGGASAAVTALTNTGVPVTTYIAVAAGNTFQLTGPATAQTYISGFVLANSAASGITVHRAGLSGSVSGSLLGGQTSGVLHATAANQVIAARSCYQWSTQTGLIVVSFGVNDQAFQSGGGTSSQNGVTLQLYQSWLQQFAAQATADGWPVLFLGEPQSPGGSSGASTLDQYISAMQQIAASNANASFVSISEMWGSYSNSQAAGLQIANSVHPNRTGYGDIAAMMYAVLLGYGSAGIAAALPG